MTMKKTMKLLTLVAGISLIGFACEAAQSSNGSNNSNNSNNSLSAACHHNCHSKQCTGTGPAKERRNICTNCCKKHKKPEERTACVNRCTKAIF